MTIDRRTLEGIESCRPGSDDLQSPELADVAARVENDAESRSVYDRVQKWDAAVSKTMDQVDVPTGLAERILARLDGPRAGDALDVAVQDAQQQAADPNAALRPLAGDAAPGGSSRRRWLSGAVALATTVVVAVVLTQYLRTPSDTPLESMADVWLGQLTPQWQAMAQAPGDFAVPSAITVEAVGWQNVGKFAGVHGAAYKLVHSTAGTARLFVMRLAKSGLPATPPSSPQFATGGRSIGYWHSGKLVYVLVVDGNQHKYRAFVNPARLPLALDFPGFRLFPIGVEELGRTIGKIV